MYSRSNTPRRCRGVAMVEFAIIAPFLLLLMLGIGELGKAFFEYNTLTKSVREGARYLSSRGPRTLDFMVMTDELRSEAKNMVVYGTPGGGGSPLVSGLSTDNISIEILNSVNIRVGVSYQYAPAAVQALPGFHYGADTPLTFTLRASTTMRML